jgi:prepilin-type N-terminal cleavage/methylation domain-containing protein
MRADTKSGNSPIRRFIAVDWRDCIWQPRIEVRRPSPTLDFHSPRRNFNFPKTMKTNLPASRRHRAGFTLIELLTVIAIIGILAAMLLPVLAMVKKHALMTKARLEATDIVTAIQGYDSAYGRFPVSAAAQNQAGINANTTPPNGDFTYGGTYQKPDASPLQIGTHVPALGNSILSNAEVIAILMDQTNYPGGGLTVNTNYQKNPQQTIFLKAKMSGDTSSPGVGTDLVYRDPWGNPYVITMDLNYDEMCKDSFYCANAVSVGGLNGLIDPTDPTGADNNWEYRGKVMVWSAGPDGKIDPAVPANQSANKDNVLSWK